MTSTRSHQRVSKSRVYSASTQALLDMLAGFATVASGADAAGSARQYVRPVLTEVR